MVLTGMKSEKGWFLYFLNMPMKEINSEMGGKIFVPYKQSSQWVPIAYNHIMFWVLIF